MECKSEGTHRVCFPSRLSNPISVGDVNSCLLSKSVILISYIIKGRQCTHARAPPTPNKRITGDLAGTESIPFKVQTGSFECGIVLPSKVNFWISLKECSAGFFKENYIYMLGISLEKADTQTQMMVLTSTMPVTSESITQKYCLWNVKLWKQEGSKCVWIGAVSTLLLKITHPTWAEKLGNHFLFIYSFIHEICMPPHNIKLSGWFTINQ